MTTRERFYECSLTSGGQRRSGYVRAWSAADAKRVFADMLAGEAVELTGKIDAVPVGERPERSVAMSGLQLRHPSNA